MARRFTVALAVFALVAAGCGAPEVPLSSAESDECRRIVEEAGSFSAFADVFQASEVDQALLVSKYLDHYRPALASGLSQEEADDAAWPQFLTEPPAIRFCRALLEGRE